MDSAARRVLGARFEPASAWPACRSRSTWCGWSRTRPCERRSARCRLPADAVPAPRAKSRPNPKHQLRRRVDGLTTRSPRSSHVSVPVPRPARSRRCSSRPASRSVSPRARRFAVDRHLVVLGAASRRCRRSGTPPSTLRRPASTRRAGWGSDRRVTSKVTIVRFAFAARRRRPRWPAACCRLRTRRCRARRQSAVPGGFDGASEATTRTK